MTGVRALSIIQPWATLLAERIKTYETRSWRTNHHGDLLIHASKTRPVVDQRIEQILWEHGLPATADLPRGVILASARLSACLPTEIVLVTDRERMLGDWTPGRYAWHLSAVRLWPEPVPARGAQGLWLYREQVPV